MDTQFVSHFMERWNKYFPYAELPIYFFYADQVYAADFLETSVEDRCLIGNLSRVREGLSFVYSEKTPGCLGGKRYSGYSQKLRVNFEYFLSCGIPGELEGERYKKTPELVRAHLESHPPFKAPARFLVFKRIDKLSSGEEPLAIIFFAPPDVLSGLFTLANYDSAQTDTVIAPMGSGCSSIIDYPLAEVNSGRARCVLGMFDVSARPFVQPNVLSFTVPAARFERMVENMDESFLATGSWNRIRSRLEPGDYVHH